MSADFLRSSSFACTHVRCEVLAVATQKSKSSVEVYEDKLAYVQWQHLLLRCSLPGGGSGLQCCVVCNHLDICL